MKKLRGLWVNSDYVKPMNIENLRPMIKCKSVRISEFR